MALTGITDEMVNGHNLDPTRVAAFAADAVVVIAHNAAFDRTFMERYCPSFEHQAWRVRSVRLNGAVMASKAHGCRIC